MSHVTLIVCGAPLAGAAADVTETLAAGGWTVSVIPTTAARPWIDQERLHHVATADRLAPSAPRMMRPRAVVACPITFNSVNKLAHGIADSPAMTVLNEALAAGTPTLLVPMVSTDLWRHPVWRSNLELLAGAGVAFLDARTGRVGTQPVEPGTADEVSARFDPAWIVASLVGIAPAA